jgi:anionic cell wall polymer biosynthesis LytR-Cps2A-Psr (LCP) family protein
MPEPTNPHPPSAPIEEAGSPTTPPSKLWLKAILMTLGFFSLFLMITTLVVSWYLWQQWQVFAQVSGVTFTELKQTVETGWDQPITQTDGYKNVLLLGVDALETRAGSPALTDTMIIASLNLDNGTINTLPLPRDIWSDEYQTKINALLYYGQEQNPDQPDAFPSQVLAEMTGLTLHHTLVISLDTLAELIDTVGGIEVDVQQSFTDPQFPNPEVDVTTETDPAKLYQPVTFEAGPQQMNGQRALMFIRSRYSDNQDEGTDLARSRRQQQVITALAEKMTDTATLTNPATLGLLYRFYQDSFADQIPLTELVAVGRQLYPVRANINFQSNSLTVIEDDQPGVIEHPLVTPNRYQAQWVYIIPDLAAFQTEVKQMLE